MKKIFLIFAFITLAYAQTTNYVNLNHRVYDLLSRMHTLGIINNYDAFELPKTKKEVFKHLFKAIENESLLNDSDSKLLDDIFFEFELDIKNITENTKSLLPSFDFKNLLDNKTNYLYYTIDSTKSSFFISAYAEGTQLFRSGNDKSESVFLGRVGGVIKGSFKDYLGYYLDASNGMFFGDKDLTYEIPELRYNYKYNNEFVTHNNMYDNSKGYLLFENENIKFKLGRDSKTIGLGPIKTIISENNSSYDNISFNLKYSVFNYSYSLNKLYAQNSSAIFIEKFMAYHRFSFDLGKNNLLSFGEIIVYANRGLDISYLNPFGFFKNLEHVNQDRDNPMLFVDYSTIITKGHKLYFMLLIDDVDFGKLGNGWWGNKLLYNVGTESVINLDNFPLVLNLQYIRIEPYVFTHHVNDNNYSSSNYSLSDPLVPNSHTFHINLKMPFHYKLKTEIGFSYKEHGANLYDNGSLITNYGGNVLEGRRDNDSEYIKFMDGKKEIYKEAYFKLDYNLLQNYRLSFLLKHRNGILNYKSYNDIFSNLSLFINI